MNRKKITSVIAVILVILMVLALVVTVVPTRAFAVTQDDIDAVQQRKEELLAQREASQAKIDGLKEQQASVIEQKAALDERNAVAQEQLELVVEQVEMYSELIEQKAQEVEAAKTVELQQLELYRTRVRAMEENGGFNVLSLILSARSFGELLAAIDDIAEIMQRDKQIENQYIAAREETERVKDEYEQTKTELEARQAELETEQAELEQMIAEATALIEDLEKDIEKAQKEYEAAEAARAAAAAEVSRLIAELNRQNEAIAAAKDNENNKPNDPPAETPAPEQPEENTGETPGDSSAETPDPTPQPTPEPTPTPTPEPDNSGVVSAGGAGVIGTGSLMWPVPSGHVVTSRFGWRIHPITGEERYHNGMDIDGYGHDGGAIVACDDGVVSLAQWSDSYGNYIIIDHGNGMQTLYAHMSGFAVSVGDTVTKGQTIGYLGATGWATGTHCHLEIFVNGSRVDPENYFSGMTFYDC